MTTTKYHKNHAVCVGHIGNPKMKLEDDVQRNISEETQGERIPVLPRLKSSADLCKHLDYCCVKDISKKGCIDYKNCMTWKFYEKYGENYNFLGI